MQIKVLYLDGCPCVAAAEERVRQAAKRTGIANVEVRRVLVETTADARRWGFSGSPTILVDDVDPFATGDVPRTLACRVYETPGGRSGSPTVDQFVKALSDRVHPQS